MPQTHRAGSTPAFETPLPSWLGLNADRRGFDGPSGPPSLTVSGAATLLTRAGLSWSTLGESAVVTFAFRGYPVALPEDVSGFLPFTRVQMEATLLALQAWSDVANITFVRQDDGGGYSNHATMLFGAYSSGADGAAAFAALPGSTASSSVAGDVWINGSLSYNAAPTVGGYGHLALVHEIGHAIGLLHPGDYDADPGVQITYREHADYYEDSNQYTVMSYFSEVATGAQFGAGRYVSAPMLDDIAAAQRLYGANYETRSGDTVYGFNSTADRPWFSAVAGGQAPVFAVWDGGGTDTLDFSGYAFAQVIDLRQGGFSNVGGLTGNVSIAIGAVIENAIGGAGDDRFYGNSADNRFTPGGGFNRIDGGSGVDTVVFSGARSAYTVSENGGAIVDVIGPEGTTEIRNAEFLVFSDLTLEVLVLSGLTLTGDVTDELVRGSGFSDSLDGSDGDDRIYGLEGLDYLGGGRGDDFMDGGAGDDFLSVDAGDDTILGGDGVDTLNIGGALSGVVLDLQAGLMTGEATGTDRVGGIERVTGSPFADRLTGDQNDNYIYGVAGVDIIRGGGGDDELVGGIGEAGGAEVLVKAREQANGSMGTAVSLDDAFDQIREEGPHTFIVPRASVVAATHGGNEYYAFTTFHADAYVRLDIDGATFDSVIRIFDANGVELARNNDGTYTGDGGVSGDSCLTYAVATPGVYYVQVSAFSGMTGTAVRSEPPPPGQTYTLNVIVSGHPTQPTYALGSTLFGDAGNDILHGTHENDVLDGGSGNDTIYAGGGNDVINGGEGWDKLWLRGAWNGEYRLLMLSEGEYLVKGAEGADYISGIEVLDLGNGTVIDLGRLYASGAFEGRPGGLSFRELGPLAWDIDSPLVLPTSGDPDSPVKGGGEDPHILPGSTGEPFFDPAPDLPGHGETLPPVWPIYPVAPAVATCMTPPDPLFSPLHRADSDLLNPGAIALFEAGRAWDWFH